MKKLFLPAFALLAAALPAFPQTAFDSSGTKLIQGTYYFREVYYITADAAGNLSYALSLTGTIIFDGLGNYNIPGLTAYDSVYGSVPFPPVSGNYIAGANGYGIMVDPISGDDVYFLASNGIFIGSATETPKAFNELIVGAQIPSPVFTNASFNGNYSLAGFAPPPPGTKGVASGAGFSFPLAPNGSGSLGTVTTTGYTVGSSKSISQTSSGVSYNFASGAVTLGFPASTSAPFFSGPEILYFSPDGNFVFGGSPKGWDFVVGVRNGAAGSSPQLAAGLYYQGGIDLSAVVTSTAVTAALDTYYGSFNASQGNIIAADRVLSGTPGTSIYPDTYPTPIASGKYTDPAGISYWLNPTGSVRIGAGGWPDLGISVAVTAPAFPSQIGPYIYPNGINNSASAAPFTAGVAGGELITIYGLGLASSTVISSSAPFPTTLGSTQVLINGAAAPLYYVSPTQIAAVVPTGTLSVAKIQVAVGSNRSNAVTELVRTTEPGLFTQTANGLGYAAAVHNATGALVTPQNPAQPGEYIQLFLTGLGAVYPISADGGAGPVNPLSNTVNPVTVLFGVTPGNVLFAGLAPTLAGLYQINVQVPPSLTKAGDYPLTIGGPDSSTLEAAVPVGAGGVNTSSGDIVPAALPPRFRRLR